MPTLSAPGGPGSEVLRPDNLKLRVSAQGTSLGPAGKAAVRRAGRGGQCPWCPAGTCMLGASLEVGSQPQKEFPAVINALKRISDNPRGHITHEARCSSPPLWDPGGLATLHPHLPREETQLLQLSRATRLLVAESATEAKSSELSFRAGWSGASPCVGGEEARPASQSMDFLESLWALRNLPVPG